MDKDKIIAVVELEDKGQDLQRLTISFYPDFKFGKVIDSDMQRDVWVGMFVLNGKPAVGNRLQLSESPLHAVIDLKYKITSVTFKAQE